MEPETSVRYRQCQKCHMYVSRYDSCCISATNISCLKTKPLAKMFIQRDDERFKYCYNCDNDERLKRFIEDDGSYNNKRRRMNSNE